LNAHRIWAQLVCRLSIGLQIIPFQAFGSLGRQGFACKKSKILEELSKNCPFIAVTRN
jgi:hypothetical protein